MRYAFLLPLFALVACGPKPWENLTYAQALNCAVLGARVDAMLGKDDDKVTARIRAFAKEVKTQATADALAKGKDENKDGAAVNKEIAAMTGVSAAGAQELNDLTSSCGLYAQSQLGEMMKP